MQKPFMHKLRQGSHYPRFGHERCFSKRGDRDTVPAALQRARGGQKPRFVVHRRRRRCEEKRQRLPRLEAVRSGGGVGSGCAVGPHGGQTSTGEPSTWRDGRASDAFAPRGCDA